MPIPTAENPHPDHSPGWVGARVRLRKPGPDDRPVTVAEAWLGAAGAVESSSAELMERWNERGIVGRGDKGRLYPKDGQRFLDELPFMYKSPYLWAEPATKP